MISGLEKCRYTDTLEEWKEKDPQERLLIDREVDRFYWDTPDQITIIEQNQREISIESQGSNSTVVWNPWIEKSVRLSQIS